MDSWTGCQALHSSGANSCLTPTITYHLEPGLLVVLVPITMAAIMPVAYMPATFGTCRLIPVALESAQGGLNIKVIFEIRTLNIEHCKGWSFLNVPCWHNCGVDR